MERYLGYRGKNILLVSDRSFKPEGLETIKVPPELKHISSSDLVIHYQIRKGKVMPRDTAALPQDMKLALVGCYQIQCGIATYSERLWPEIVKGVKDYKIFTEKGTPASDNVVPCWVRGKPLDELIAEIKKYGPDVIHIQHEYGIFPDARYWTSLIANLSGYKIFVTLHSVYRDHGDKIVCEAVIPHIIAHSEDAADVLRYHGVSGKIHVIHHGCTPCSDPSRYWNLYRSPLTLVQFGFGFRYKGWETAIEAVAKLKERHPEIFYTGLFSESPFSKDFHVKYYQELQELIEKLGVQSNAGIIRGFQSDKALDSFLRTNMIAIFPYPYNGAHTVYGASGAARYAMQAAVPIIVGDVPLFADLKGVCPRVKDTDELVKEIENLLDPKAREAQVKIQNNFIEKFSWANVAKQHLEAYGS